MSSILSSLPLSSASNSFPMTGSLTFKNSLKCWLQLMFQMRKKKFSSIFQIIVYIMFIFSGIGKASIPRERIFSIEPTLNSSFEYEFFNLSTNYSYIGPNNEITKEFIKRSFPYDQDKAIYVNTFDDARKLCTDNQDFNCSSFFVEILNQTNFDSFNFQFGPAFGDINVSQFSEQVSRSLLNETISIQTTKRGIMGSPPKFLIYKLLYHA